MAGKSVASELPPGADGNRFETLPADESGCVCVRYEFAGVRAVLRLGARGSRRVWRRQDERWVEMAEAEVQSLVNRLSDAARNAAWDYDASDAAEKYAQILELFAATYGKSRADLDDGCDGLK